MKSLRHDREGAELTKGRTARREVPGFRALAYSSHWYVDEGEPWGVIDSQLAVDRQVSVSHLDFYIVHMVS